MPGPLSPLCLVLTCCRGSIFELLTNAQGPETPAVKSSHVQTPPWKANIKAQAGRSCGRQSTANRSLWSSKHSKQICMVTNAQQQICTWTDKLQEEGTSPLLAVHQSKCRSVCCALVRDGFKPKWLSRFTRWLQSTNYCLHQCLKRSDFCLLCFTHTRVLTACH